MTAITLLEIRNSKKYAKSLFFLCIVVLLSVNILLSIMNQTKNEHSYEFALSYPISPTKFGSLPQKTSRVNRIPLVVIWDKIVQNGTALDVLPVNFSDADLKCREFNPTFPRCRFTTNREQAKNGDVLVIGLQEWANSPYVPDFRRPSQQPWVLFGIESPAHLYSYIWTESRKREKTIQLLNGHINWTMTYRLDSTIPAPYSRFDLLAEPDLSQIYNRFQKKSATAVFVASYCDNRMSHREEYVAQLIAHGLQVEHVGDCSQFQDHLAPFAKKPECLRTKLYGSTSECDEAMSKRYKFYLAFENSLCNDYVTEKFYRAASLDVIPVVLNRANMASFAPPHSYIDAKEFETPQQLVDYLRKVSDDVELFESYFWWKPYYKITNMIDGLHYFRSLCQLCSFTHQHLNDPDGSWPAYEDLEDWWVAKGNCTEGQTRGENQQNMLPEVLLQRQRERYAKIEREIFSEDYFDDESSYE